MCPLFRERALAFVACLWIVSPIWPQEQPSDRSAASAEDSSRSPEKKPAFDRAADKSKYAATDLSQVDADFAFQGEFFGIASPASLPCANLGLQVIALGDGRFDAVFLQGGLPGAGWDRSTKTDLSGVRNDAGLTLAGGGYEVRVSPDQAIVLDNRGAPIATLRRIHRISATQDALPPPGAFVLFDGTNTNSFEGGTMTEDGLLAVGPVTKMSVGDFQMHIEFRSPYMPHARGQGRGNSGVYIQQRYEVQILDSFGLKGENNECGGLYKQHRPDVNLCLPPLSWQTYDIVFTSAKWDVQGSKTSNARITLLHNGVPVHQEYELAGKTGAGKAEEPLDRPILLQNHGNPVRFRNIWLQPIGPAVCEPADCCQMPTVRSSFLRGCRSTRCASW